MQNPIISVKVNQNEFIWDKDNDIFTFDGAPALLFWDSAIELFMKTIEEISGSDVSSTVFESTGFRMGQLVSSYYTDKYDIVDILNHYSDIYRNAGWGKVKIDYYSFEEKKVVIHLKNSWEHRIFHSMDKTQAGVLLPSHWAGVFTELFEENMWYKITRSQLDGHDYDEIEVFASSTTPTTNIHKLARQKEQHYINELEHKVEQRTAELTELVKDLSTPVIPVLKDILVIPLIGTFTDERIEELTLKAMYEFSKQKAAYLLIDLTGIKDFDEMTIHGLQRLIRAIRLLGGNCILVGISPSLSMKITNSGVEMKDITFFSTLQHGVEYALGENGFDIVERKNRK
ncbi:STAS domain-containing protein [Bacillus sp. UMB0893]|uniref:STAS domain-containing protein n=1 Tax=Bacillus sp. UMB0893 TaxID=2066053 RepID=UPI000C774292|nr:STAS domain-containing protein [Bacillus sp. UMB0893]PLR69087.1 hypothetical protein CYJ36_01085 [Bacillus sp. UMB0893]